MHMRMSALRTRCDRRRRDTAHPPTPPTHAAAVNMANRGKKEQGDDGGKKAEKEEQYRMQQELLEARRTGSAIRDASKRRQKVSETLAERKAVRRNEREALGRGEMPDTLKSWKV